MQDAKLDSTGLSPAVADADVAAASDVSIVMNWCTLAPNGAKRRTRMKENKLACVCPGASSSDATRSKSAIGEDAAATTLSSVCHLSCLKP